MPAKLWITIGAIFAGISVAAGAFGTHGLEGSDQYTERELDIFETAARYQMYHGLALVAVGLLALRDHSKLMVIAGISISFGVVVFCGLLYALVFTKIKMLGAIVPIGGLAFIVGWVALAAAAWLQIGKD